MEIASVTIDAEDWTDRVQAITITRETGGASSTCALTVEDDLTTKARVGYAIVGTDTVADRLTPQREVIVTASDATVLFRGVSSRLSVNRNNARSNSYVLACRDYTHLLETASITTEMFTAQTDEQILDYLFATYLPAISTAQVAGFATVHSLELSDESLMSALRKIQQRTGAEWFVDPYLRLQYYDPSTQAASFGFSDNPDGVTTFEFLRESFSYSEDFATPANSVTVVGTKLISESAWDSFAVPANADDGTAEKYRFGVYPPAGGTDSITAGLHARNSYDGAFYYIAVALVRFDTSSLPDDATITSATLSLQATANFFNANAASLGAEYYASTNWPIDAADWTSTPSNTAHGYTPLSSFWGAGMPMDLTLNSPDANISKTGYTGFRLHIKVTGTPTGENYVQFHPRGSATGIPPALEVSYTRYSAGAMSQTYNDTESQTIYGTFEKVIVEEGIKTEAEALARAQIEAERLAWPIRSGALAWERDGIGVGEYLPLAIHAFGVFGDFTVKRLKMAWTKNTTRYTADFGEHQPDLVKYLARMVG